MDPNDIKQYYEMTQPIIYMHIVMNAMSFISTLVVGCVIFFDIISVTNYFVNTTSHDASKTERKIELSNAKEILLKREDIKQQKVLQDINDKKEETELLNTETISKKSSNTNDDLL